MKKLLVILTFSILVPVLFSCSKSKEIPDYAVVSFFIGDVQKNGQSINIGDQITEKDVIVTAKQSSCDLKIGESIIRIKENSKMAFATLLKKDGEDTVLELEQGKLLCKPKKLLKDDSFTVKTPTAVAGVRGTQFTVEADINKTTRIKVFDGKVKVAKRVKALDNDVAKVLTKADPLEKKESVIITLDEANKAASRVEKALANNSDIDAVIEKEASGIVINDNEQKQFAVEEFKEEEKSEIIKIEDKPEPIQKQIKKIIVAAKKAPKTQGRLLITKSEVYFIKDGQIEWEGKVLGLPVKSDGMVFIATDDYVFAAKNDGPVLWKLPMINDGKVEVREDGVAVFVKGQEMLLSAKSGKEIK